MAREILLFDVGGVLADWDGTTPLVTLTDGRLTREEARRFWLEFEPLAPFETGQSTCEGFLEAAVEALSLNMTPEAFGWYGAARALGVSAFQVKGKEALEACLEEKGYLLP
ncbi:hypothetical protein SAMN05421848_2948 [Kushneria avicenniae]|uniref:Hydrolase of the HAD superfamily n=1 Tax=Kushneria avicenniae TaxID=402385 RepID=A0A1I1MGX1_9GAMM|nr:hypothetical protein [Kushneria avicenniae]SFC84721.1 hypothetical protein SAMN05421848_2948 [Kushneria avicenniae]